VETQLKKMMTGVLQVTVLQPNVPGEAGIVLKTPQNVLNPICHHPEENLGSYAISFKKAMREVIV
jgi:hypothetical protein